MVIPPSLMVLFFLIMKFFALSTMVYFALHPLTFLIRHRLLHLCALLGATRGVFVIHNIALSVQMYNAQLQPCTMPGATRRVFVIHFIVL